MEATHSQFSTLNSQLIYEDRDIIVLNKKPLELVQTDKAGSHSLDMEVKQYLAAKGEKAFCGIIHRLDRPVSGLVVFAKNEQALAALNLQMQNRTLEKYYWAIVQNCPPKESDTLVHFLTKNEKTNKSFIVGENEKAAKKAVLSYRLLGKSDRYCLLEINLQTGRHHQIRVQMAHIGLPIKGDLKYGAKRSNPDGSIYLHCRKMRFSHLTTKEKIQFIAPVPENTLWNFFEKEHGQNNLE